MRGRFPEMGERLSYLIFEGCALSDNFVAVGVESNGVNAIISLKCSVRNVFMNGYKMHFFKKQTRKLLNIFFDPAFIYLTLVGNAFLVVATLAVYWVEKGVNPNIHSYFDSLWWGVATITTVAYGDVVPVTFTGRIIGIVLIYTGTLMFVTFTGLILMLLMKEEVEHELSPLEREMRKEGRGQVHIEKILQEIKARLDQLEIKK